MSSDPGSAPLHAQLASTLASEIAASTLCPGTQLGPQDMTDTAIAALVLAIGVAGVVAGL